MPLRRKIRLGHIVALVFLLVCYFFIFQFTWKLQKEYDRLTASYNAEYKIEKLRSLIVEAETGVRGYYITKDEAFLKPYTISRQIIPPLYEEIKKLESRNPAQLALLDSIKQLIDQRLDLMKINIGLFQAAGMQSTPDVENNRQKGQAILENISSYSQQFISAENELMNERKGKLTGFFTATLIITIASLITAIVAIIYALYTYNKESAARDESSKKNIQYQRQLENNIAELKRMDAEVTELRSLEKFTSTGRIARTIAHEVRNPLTNITLAAEQLQDLAKDSESSMLFDMITRNSVRINQLISDLLNATKIMELQIQKVNINELLDETLQMAADRIELNNIKVEKDYSPNLCNVAVDIEKIKIALLNIIVNAIEAMEKNKGVLKIRTRQEDKLCLIEVGDNGVGMDEDTLQKLFEPYFTNKPKGNGLGLTNSQNIILSHRGKITVQSKARNGSKFIITLQLAD